MNKYIIRLTRILPVIAIAISAWTIQPTTLVPFSFLGELAQAGQFDASRTVPSQVADPNKLIDDLQNWQPLRIKVGSNIFLVDKSDMKHFLKRHHPKYWDGSIKRSQTFLNPNMTISDVEQTIRAVMNTRQPEVTKIGLNGYAQLPPTNVKGTFYVLGLNRGHVGQFYPKAR
jgi:hypothetical protein